MPPLSLGKPGFRQTTALGPFSCPAAPTHLPPQRSETGCSSDTSFLSHTIDFKFLRIKLHFFFSPLHPQQVTKNITYSWRYIKVKEHNIQLVLHKC